MKAERKIENHKLLNMIRLESYSENNRYMTELNTTLSSLVDSGEVLGPLILSTIYTVGRIKLTGSAYYTRFRPGDRVDIRFKKSNINIAVDLSKDWKIESIIFIKPGEIELILSGFRPIEVSDVCELFLFKSSSVGFHYQLLNRLDKFIKSDRPVVLDSGLYDLDMGSSDFKNCFNKLNTVQQNAIMYLIENNLNGAVQGPPGTGKTQLLQSIIALALSSKMKVCVTSFTNTAVDNLLSRIVKQSSKYDWIRISDLEKIKKNMYSVDQVDQHFFYSNFKDEFNELNLFGATMHKLAYSKINFIFDLLVIDEAGQVPIYFWPFIQRLAKRVVLVGDQFQLPPVFLNTHKDLQFNNVFSMYLTNNTPMLETQYRMRSEIQKWSSEKFYKGKLVPHESVSNHDYFAHCPALLTDKYTNYKYFDSSSVGLSSINEANFIIDKIEKILKFDNDAKNIGVICPYRSQAGIVNAALQNRFGVELASKVLVDTVERFQGQEREIIFLSMSGYGSSSEDLSFLSDSKRLNVSVTRAKSRFFCLSGANLLNRSNSHSFHDLHEFLNWVHKGNAKIRKAA